MQRDHSFIGLPGLEHLEGRILYVTVFAGQGFDDGVCTERNGGLGVAAFMDQTVVPAALCRLPDYAA